MLRRLIDFADLTAPVLVEAAVAAAMVRPYAWLLARVGDAGIKLTAAGYLPPVDVAAAVAALRLAQERIRAGNREGQSRPVPDRTGMAPRPGFLASAPDRLRSDIDGTLAAPCT